MKNGSFFFSFFAQQELIWFEHLNAEKRMLLPGAFEQTIIGCGEPVRLRLPRTRSYPVTRQNVR